MDTNEKAALCERMAASSLDDAAGFWPGAPLYFLERTWAAEAWNGAARAIRQAGLGSKEMLLTAGDLTHAAEIAHRSGLSAKAAERQVKAQTYRRIARILDGAPA